mmetsp:Transcript_9359/g.23684  ORF Transcript_9359/g.23684 Transcript_9359/m.23684 type:complete len:283 (+) Transcript_9359:877-1725(+)
MRSSARPATRSSQLLPKPARAKRSAVSCSTYGTSAWHTRCCAQRPRSSQWRVRRGRAGRVQGRRRSVRQSERSQPHSASGAPPPSTSTRRSATPMPLLLAATLQRARHSASYSASCSQAANRGSANQSAPCRLGCARAHTHCSSLCWRRAGRRCAQPSPVSCAKLPHSAVGSDSASATARPCSDQRVPCSSPRWRRGAKPAERTARVPSSTRWASRRARRKTAKQTGERLARSCSLRAHSGSAHLHSQTPRMLRSSPRDCCCRGACHWSCAQARRLRRSCSS